MAHTDRDDTRHFWKRHYGRGFRDGDCTLRTIRVSGWSLRGWCWCDTVHNGWTQPYKYEQGKPSWWNKDCRREERAKARNQMNKARNGHTDWDDLTINYRRPWYW